MVIVETYEAPECTNRWSQTPACCRPQRGPYNGMPPCRSADERAFIVGPLSLFGIGDAPRESSGQYEACGSRHSTLTPAGDLSRPSWCVGPASGSAPTGRGSFSNHPSVLRGESHPQVLLGARHQGDSVWSEPRRWPIHERPPQMGRSRLSGHSGRSPSSCGSEPHPAVKRTSAP